MLFTKYLRHFQTDIVYRTVYRHNFNFSTKIFGVEVEHIRRSSSFHSASVVYWAHARTWMNMFQFDWTCTINTVLERLNNCFVIFVVPAFELFTLPSTNTNQAIYLQHSHVPLLFSPTISFLGIRPLSFSAYT